jgi:muramoyltetrapeptide carboxypeptidase
MITPPFLVAGNTIGLVCPAGYMAMEKVKDCIRALESWGFQVRLGRSVGSESDNYFSGTDEERLADFQEMLDDDSIHAILCARGGYGLSRIIDDIDFRKFRKQPKWLIGFSDVTILHSHILGNYGIETLHAPMAAAFIDADPADVYIRSLKHALIGKTARYSIHPHVFNRDGETSGRLVGGNLTLLAHLCGTNSDIRTRGKILFLEDVGEYIYNVDRMMYQLKRSGKLKNLAGLIVGGFTDMKDTERPFGRTAEEVIFDIVAEYNFPVCFEFPVSHAKPNFTLKIGARYQLDVGEKVVLQEM